MDTIYSLQQAGTCMQFWLSETLQNGIYAYSKINAHQILTHGGQGSQKLTKYAGKDYM